MTEVRDGIRMLKLVLAAGAASVAFSTIGAGSAIAQQAQEGRQVKFDIPAGDLSGALITIGRQADVQIAFLPDRVAGRRVKALRGTFTVEQALDQMLADSGLTYRRVRPGSYVVSGPSAANLKKARAIASDLDADNGYVNGQANVPEILVRGRRLWSLNTDLPRGENEAQPYTVFNREQIARSGSTNLEEFFRDYLGSNASVRTARQGNGTNGRDSAVNLRGFGYESTLILVDGRRYAEPNNGTFGEFLQSSVSGIPLDQIERIEVLSSSAAGQYGSNAIGGVINIILRRDFKGVELGGYLSGSTRGDGFERRLSANATFSPFKGTSLTFSGSWKKADPLYAGDRPFVNDRLAFALANAPNYLTTPTIGPIYSTTPNIRSTNGANLVLKPQYAVNGVTNLNSSLTYVPAGFQGVGVNGAGVLLTNAGKQNLEPGINDEGGAIWGDRASLLTGATVWNGSAAFRSEVTDWLTLYGSAAYSKDETVFSYNSAPSVVTLRANSPVNPFTTDVSVTFPSSGYMKTSKIDSELIQVFGGAIVKLPWKWQANFDANASWSTSNNSSDLDQLSPAFHAMLNVAQTVDVIRDTIAFPIAFEFDAVGRHFQSSPAKTTVETYSLKLAGPISFARLWGGAPVATIVAETRSNKMGHSVGIVDGPETSQITLLPERSTSTRSVFGEIVFPILGADNNVPAIHGLELRLAGRYDAYKGVGAGLLYNCVPQQAGLLTPAQLAQPCPHAGMNIIYATTRNDTFNPVVAAKWSITPDIAFRGSYSTGYKPPYLTKLIGTPGGLNLTPFGIPVANGVFVSALDPERGNEAIGQDFFGFARVVDAQTGGNPDVDPETSKSWSFGTILTPRFLDGLTLRVDWTRITITNAYFEPGRLLTPVTPLEQEQFNDFLAAHPERFTRAAPGPGDSYSVGRITAIDASTANLSRFRNDSLDFSGNYQVPIGTAQLQINGSATLLLKQFSQLTPSSPLQRTDGVVSIQNFYGSSDSLRFRGTLTTVYSTENWSAGGRVRYHSGYYLRNDRMPVSYQGSATVPGQAMLDVFGSWRILKQTDVRAGINNLLDKRPPMDATRGSGYASYGDPMLRSFYVNVTQRF